MPRPCLERGCGELVARGSRCTRHQREHEAARKASGATGRNAVPRDAHLRRRVLRRDGHRCVVCGSTGTPEQPLKAHHVDGDPRNNAIENLETLCHDDHIAADQKLRERLKGRRTRAHADLSGS